MSQPPTAISIDFATIQRDNPEGCGKIVTTPMMINSAAPTLVTDPGGSESLDNVAVSMNGDGAGG